SEQINRDLFTSEQCALLQNGERIDRRAPLRISPKNRKVPFRFQQKCSGTGVSQPFPHLAHNLQSPERTQQVPRRVSVDRRVWLVRPTGCQVIRATALGQHHPDIELPGKGAWSYQRLQAPFCVSAGGKPAGKAEEGHMNTSVRRETLVIIGNGMVGHHCVARLVEQDALERFEVRVFGEERQRAYDRVHLSEYFGG